MTLDELERRAELRRQEEVAAILERISTPIGSDDEPNSRPRKPEPPYHPTASTEAAFRYLVAVGDVGRLRAWLAARPKDALLLLAMLESLAPC